MFLSKSLLVCDLFSNYLDTIFHRVGIFNFKEPYQVSSSWIMSLVLNLKNHWPCPSLSRFSVMLSSSGFIGLCFTLTSVIHFELILVKSVRSVSRFIFVRVSIQFLQHHLCYLCSSVKNKLATFMGVYSWPLYLAPSIYLSVLSPMSDCFDYGSFIVSLEVE